MNYQYRESLCHIGPQRSHVRLIMRSHSIEQGAAREVEDEKL